MPAQTAFFFLRFNRRGAARLAARRPERLFQRFREAPAQRENLPEFLRLGQTQELIFFNPK